MHCLCRVFLDNQFYTAFSILLNYLLLLTLFCVGSCWLVPCAVIPSFCCTCVVYLCYLACSCQLVIYEAMSMFHYFSFPVIVFYSVPPTPPSLFKSTTTVAYLCYVLHCTLVGFHYPLLLFYAVLWHHMAHLAVVMCFLCCVPSILLLAGLIVHMYRGLWGSPS
jgi:hypothetical protein